MSDTQADKKKTVKVDPDLHKKLKKIAVEEGRHLEKVIDTVIKKGLEKDKK